MWFGTSTVFSRVRLSPRSCTIDQQGVFRICTVWVNTINPVDLLARMSSLLPGAVHRLLAFRLKLAPRASKMHAHGGRGVLSCTSIPVALCRVRLSSRGQWAGASIVRSVQGRFCIRSRCVADCKWTALDNSNYSTHASVRMLLPAILV